MSKLFFAFIGMLFVFAADAQTTPISTLDCGWTYLYDNAGNRIARTYISCTNPPGSSGKKDNSDSILVNSSIDVSKGDIVESEIEIVLLYPNPTQGKFQVEFSKELENASIFVLDNNGRQVFESKASGSQVPFDLTGFASGTYHVTITTPKKTYNQSVIKRE